MVDATVTWRRLSWVETSIVISLCARLIDTKNVIVNILRRACGPVIIDFVFAYMILKYQYWVSNNTAAFKADFIPPCSAEQLVPGTVMCAPGNFPTLCCGVTPHSKIAKKRLFDILIPPQVVAKYFMFTVKLWQLGEGFQNDCTAVHLT